MNEKIPGGFDSHKVSNEYFADTFCNSSTPFKV